MGWFGPLGTATLHPSPHLVRFCRGRVTRRYVLCTPAKWVRGGKPCFPAETAITWRLWFWLRSGLARDMPVPKNLRLQARHSEALKAADTVSTMSAPINLSRLNSQRSLPLNSAVDANPA